MYIFELAKNRSDIKRELMSKTPMIIEHLEKLILSPNNPARNHWISEIHAFIHTIDISKSTKKFPSANFIFESTFGCLEDKYRMLSYVSTEIRDICEIENIKIPKDMKKYQKEILSVCFTYFSWLAESLSKDGRIVRSDVKMLIDKMIPEG